MSKEIYISSTPHETRLAIVEKDELTEIYYERENEYTLAGSIYNGKVTRVLPGMQSSFVDVGLERDAFLYITDFMEEQGDAADFDSGESRGSGRRERGRPRGEAEAGSPPATEAEAASSVGDDRSERHSRRDRGRSTSRSDARVTEPLASNGSSEADTTGEQGADEELGAGAPGADGSRRWRGRRGRRRGRGPGEGGAEIPPAAPESELPEAAGDGESDEFAGADPKRSAPAPAPEMRQFSGNDERGREPSPERSPSERSERRRDDRRGRDAERERGSGRGARYVSRDEAEGDALDLTASAEPFILPGESLSKYRQGGDVAGESGSRSAGPSLTPMVTPSTEFKLTGAWDGSNVLPGETLSRYRERPAATAEPARSRAESPASDTDALSTTGRSRRSERDMRRGSPASVPPATAPDAPSRGLDPAEAVQGGVSSFDDVEPTELRFNEDGSIRANRPLEDDLSPAAFAAFDEADAMPEMPAPGEQALAAAPYEPQTDLAPAATEQTPSLVLEAVEEFHETVADFEPGDDASASYRVDPAGTREFRQSAPDADVLVDVRFNEDDPVAQEGPEALTGGEFTTLQPSGELISEWPLTPEAETATEEAATGVAPIDHEKVVQSVALENAETISPTEQGFNPGDGELEEELLDDEDGDLPHLEAGFTDNEMEEETLEGASELSADLGTMIREMSIDQITSAGPDDLEEDFDIPEDELEEDELEEDELEDDESADDDREDDELAAGEADGFEGSFGDANSSEENGASSEVGAFAGEPGRAGDRSGSAEDGERAPRREGRQRGRNSQRGERGNGGRNGGRDERPRHSGDTRPAGRMSRHQAQTSNLPAISDLLKPGQEVLVQIAKEPMAKKGARITSHIALPGRFLVFMPTVQHVGVSRKIESDGERRRLKEILLSERGEASGGFIVRTAASGASEEELRSDLRFLLNLWADIKQRSESSKSPALIYHDLNLVERILRDQVTDNFSAIWVDTEAEYERVLRFLQRFQPSLLRRVKLYTKDTPLFEQFGITEEINKALRSKVWLKSGGSIVINQTEALVAIDINTGKYVGKTARLEDTIVKTNLDAIPEIVRQIRLRDLGGIIVIDFIDMDERKNRAKVLAVLEEELKKDRAPSKVLQFNDFGLVAITRKRVKQSLERTLSQTCNTCAGTGMVKSPVTVCNEIFIELRKMHKHLDKGDVMLRVNPEVVKQLKSGSGKWLQEMEEIAGKTILVKSDPSLHPEQFDIQ